MRIRGHMTSNLAFNQGSQIVKGSQTIVGGDAGSVLSGTFNGDVYIDSSGAQIPLLIPSQISSPTPDFIGREEELKELLDAFEGGTVAVCLRGMGGVGKTALAFALAARLRDNFPDGQLFVKMMGTSPQPLAPAEAMAQVIRSYAPTYPVPENEAEIENSYRSLLDGKRALLLLDNAFDGSQTRPLLPPANCRMIITSRRKFTLPGMKVKDLEVLKLDKAVELLHLTAGTDLASDGDSKADWENLARLCGCLPVALKAAGSYLANTPDSSPEEYIKELQDEKRRLQSLGKGKDGVDVEEDIDLKLSLSYGSLKPEEARVLGELSVFPSDFDAKAEEVVCQDEGHNHLRELERWSLVEYEMPSGGEGRYHLHDLVRIFADGKLEDASKDAVQSRHAMHYQSVLWNANNLLLQGGKSLQEGLNIFDSEWVNIQAGQSRAKANSGADSEMAEICSNFARTGSILGLRLRPGVYTEWLESALACARQIENLEAEGAHLGNLGNAYADLGETKKAIEYYEKAKKIAEEIGDRRNEGNWLGNLGLAYADLGDARKAINYHEQALLIDREIGNRRSEGVDLGNLGLAYAALGDALKAIDYYDQALLTARDIGDRINEGVWLGNIGNAYATLGDARKAIDYYDQALLIARDIGDRRNEGVWLGNIGNAYADLGDAKKAIEYYDQALGIAREIGDRRNEGAHLGNLGAAYAALGDARKAIDYYDQALLIARDIGDRRNEGVWLGSLGNAYADLGDAKKAIDHYEQQLAITREIGDRRGEGTALWNKSLALDGLEKRGEAVLLAEEALAIYEQIEDPYAERVRQQLAEWRR